MVTNAVPLHESQYKGQHRNLLNFYRKALLISGIIPPENLSESPTKQILFVLYHICWYSLFALLYVAQILAVEHFWGNMEITTFVLVGFLGATGAECYGIYGKLYSSSIVKLLEFLEHNVHYRMTEMGLNKNHIQIIEKAKVIAKRLNTTIILSAAFTTIFWIFFPITRKYVREHNSESVNVTTEQYEDRWLDLCFIIWAPFDITVSPYYEITYVCQAIILTTAVAHWSSVQTLIVSLIIYTSAHLKVLESFLIEMKTSLLIDSANGVSLIMPNNIQLGDNNAGSSTAHQSVKQRGTDESHQEYLSMNTLESSGFKNEKLKDFIVNFVNYHEAVNEFVRRVNETFGPVLFCTFFIGQLLVCLELFQVAATEFDGTSLMNLLDNIAILTPHFIFCWYGNEVIANSELLRQAAFESSLVQHSSEFKHFILMVMKNTQKPLQFSALGFYTLSLQEFTKTMNAVYAYFNILKNLHGQQEIQ